MVTGAVASIIYGAAELARWIAILGLDEQWDIVST